MAFNYPGFALPQGYDGKSNIGQSFAGGFNGIRGPLDELNSEQTLGDYVKSLATGAAPQGVPAAPAVPPLSQFGLPPSEVLTQLMQNPQTRQQGIDLVRQAQAARAEALDPTKQLQLKKLQYDVAHQGDAPRDTITLDANRRAALGQQQGLTGEALQEFVLTGKLPDAAGDKTPTVVSIYDANGREQKGYMDGDKFTPLGSPKADTPRPEFTAPQALAAGYADRMANADSILDDPKLATVQTDLWQKAISDKPLIGDSLNSPEFQQADQAQRDFINALLRRESGAAIAQSEFDNARKQYFPQPGDSEVVLKQKAANRKNAIKGVGRSAGPAYEPPDTANYLANPDALDAPAAGEVVDGYRFKGGDPSDQNSWEPAQ